MVNKHHLVGMMFAHIQQTGVAIIIAAEEGDADVVIVRRAIERGDHDDVVIIADDRHHFTTCVLRTPVLHGNETTYYRHLRSAESTRC